MSTKKKKGQVPAPIQKHHLRIKVNKSPDYCLLVLQICGISKRHCRQQFSGGTRKSMPCFGHAVDRVCYSIIVF